VANSRHCTAIHVIPKHVIQIQTRSGAKLPLRAIGETESLSARLADSAL
jgi:hypothetical protein